MSQLHEDENIVVLGFGDHIFSEDFNESLNLQKLDYGVIFDHFWPGDLDRETVETLQNVSEKGRLSNERSTLNFSRMDKVTALAEKAFLKYPDYSLRKAFWSLNWRSLNSMVMSPRVSVGKRVCSFSRALGSLILILSSCMGCCRIK